MNETTKPKRSKLFYVKLAVSVGLLTWMVSSADLDAVGKAMLAANPWWLLAALGLQLVGTFFTTTRWRSLLVAQNIRFPIRFLFGSCMVGSFAKQFLPSTIGGDAVRMFDTWRAGAPKSVAVAALTVDRLMGLMALVLFALIAAFFTHELTDRSPALLVWLTAGAVGLSLTMWLLFYPSQALLRLIKGMIGKLPQKLQGVFTKILGTVTMYRGHTAQLTRGFLVSVLLQVNVVTFYFFISQALGMSIDYSKFYLIVPVAIFVMLIPISINGIGLREGVFIFLLGAFGIDTEMALAFSWLEYGLSLVYGGFGGIVYMLRRSFPAAPRSSAKTLPKI